MRRIITNKTARIDSILLADAFENFLRSKAAQNLSKATISCYSHSFKYYEAAVRENINRIYETYLQEEPPQYLTLDEALNIEQIETWVSNMLKEGKKPTSINHYIRDIRTFANWCADRDYINPIKKIKLIKQQEPLPKCFSDEELKAILRKPKREANFVEWRNWAIANFGLDTGFRAASICNIKLSDIDFKNKTIALTYSKTNIANYIGLSGMLEKVLREYIFRYGAFIRDNSPLFPTSANTKLTSESLSHSFNKYCKERGSETTSVHSLRHSFARNYIRNGGNMAKLQKILGHSTMEMTRKYVALFGEDIKEDFDRFSPLNNIACW